MASLALVAGCRAGTPSPLAPPPPEVIAEARGLVEAMKRDDRGPYLRIRWYCNDGTVLPPTAYACVPHGGGVQYAEFHPDRQRLAALGWSVGTIFTALPYAEFLDAARRNQRMRELALERYLVDTDDGWVLRKARTYRGRVQVEDEERVGRELLVRLLADPVWVKENFLLARETVRVVPHHGGSDRTRETRRLSQELAEASPTFEPLRVRIHTAPGAQDLELTRSWILGEAQSGAAPEVLALARRLEGELEGLYGTGRDWLGEALDGLRGSPRHRIWAARVRPLTRVHGYRRVELLAGALASARELVSASDDGEGNLAALDLALQLERELILAAVEVLRRGGLSRRRLLQMVAVLTEAAGGIGLLSPREVAAGQAEVQELLKARTPTPERYASGIHALSRIPAWALGTIRHTYAEALVRYGALEPRSDRFVDDLARGSPLLPLSDALGALNVDVDRSTGRGHRILGESASGVVGLNPGLGRGTLRWVDPSETGERASYPRDSVVVLPHTVSTLNPAAGILSLAEGNLLSHVQLLARNLGIPNAYVSPALADRLRQVDGLPVVMAVGTGGSVVVERAPATGVQLMSGRPVAAGVTRVAAPRPDLSSERPLSLRELHAGLSGRVVGPKAANLGELARLFPGKVAAALALPFGFFHRHTADGEDSPRRQLDDAYARHRAGRLDDAGLAAALAAVREQLAGRKLSLPTRARLRNLVLRELGVPGEIGVFVRSDTNVEDLPGFTGAGLNQTIPNLVVMDEIMAAIPRVWSSMLTPRALAWRGSMLARPEEVYSSVLLMRAVPAEKSGVLVTRDLIEGGEGLTVSTAWGVGGAVDGEAAEVLVLRPDGGVRLAAEAKAAYKRVLAPGGGLEVVPAPAGAVLTAEEQAALRQVARDLAARRLPARDEDGQLLPWDIEFGFVGGELTLFQIRPLIQRGNAAADAMVAQLVEGGGAPPARLDLTRPVVGMARREAP